MLKGTRNLSALYRPTRKFASLARFTSRCAFTMRGISLDGNAPRFFAPELNSDLMFEGTRKLPALCRTERTVAMPKRVTYRCALTMGGISLNRNCLHFLVPELSSDFMLKRTSNLSAQSRLKRTVPALVRFISRCAFSMRGISLGGNYPRFLVPELSSHLVSSMPPCAHGRYTRAIYLPMRIHNARHKPGCKLSSLCGARSKFGFDAQWHPQLVRAMPPYARDCHPRVIYFPMRIHNAKHKP